MSDNPYLGPILDDSESTDSEVERIRRAHLGREANIRAFGGLMYLQSTFLFLIGVIWVVMTIACAIGIDIGLDDPGVENEVPPLFMASFLLLLSAIPIAFGYWVWRGAGHLRRLSSSGRPAGWVMGSLILLNPPLGTLLGLGMLNCLLGQKAQFVLSPEYRDIVAQTPHIKAKWSVITKVLIGILVFVLILIAGIAFSMLVTEGLSALYPPDRP